MSVDSIASIATASFRDFVCNAPSSRFLLSEQESLAGYIRAWVRYGPAVVDCLGSYENYLVGIIAIISRWHQDPTLLDYDPVDSEERKHVERRVEHIFPAGCEMDWIVDPHFFAAHAFAALHPDHDTWFTDDLK